MAISRSLMNRQLQADGGIMQVAPREKFGLGSSIKKFVRKIIPNEVAEVAVKAAPFVAPFNPAVAAAMSGLGTFDQTGSIGQSLKGGALTYGLGQGARYLGGAGFQGNPFAADGGAFRGGLEGLKGGFSSPLGNQTGFQLGKPIEAVEGVGIDTTVPLKKPMIPGAGEGGIDLATGGADAVGIISDTVVDKSIVTKNDPGFLKNLFDGVSNQDYGKIAKTIGDGAKKFGKVMFTNKDGSIDKAAVLGAITFAGSYAEARALAAETGVDDDLTEEEYNEAIKDEKKEEYAGYLTNFFGGVKDGGRIGFEFGANEMIKTQLLEEIMPEQDGEEMIIIMTEEGPIPVKKSVYESMPNMFMDTTTSAYGDAGRGRPVPEFANGGRIGFSEGMNEARQLLLNKKYLELLKEYSEAGLTDADSRAMKEANEFVRDFKMADGGRIGFKRGSPEATSEIGIMSIDVEAGDDDEEDMMMAAGINFSRAEKSYLFRRLGGSGGADRSYTMPNLYRILSNPNKYPDDAAVLKEIAIMGLGKGQKDGGRIGFSDGSENFMAPPPKKITEFNKDMVTEFMAGNMPEFKGELMSENYTQGGVTDLDAIFKIYSMGGSYDDIRKTLNSSLTDMELEKIIQSMIPKQENFYAETKAKGGRIGYKGGANRVSELLILRDGILAKDANADVSDIDAEIFQLTGKVFKSVGGIGDVPTGEMRKNNAGVIERDYRDKGGFVPVGIKERADDVPAMLSKNEFVMTADAVRGIGGGDVEKGSKRLYNTMKQAEKVGKA